MKIDNILHYSIGWKSHRLWPVQVVCLCCFWVPITVIVCCSTMTRVIILYWMLGCRMQIDNNYYFTQLIPYRNADYIRKFALRCNQSQCKETSLAAGTMRSCEFQLCQLCLASTIHWWSWLDAWNSAVQLKCQFGIIPRSAHASVSHFVLVSNSMNSMNRNNTV